MTYEWFKVATETQPGKKIKIRHTSTFKTNYFIVGALVWKTWALVFFLPLVSKSVYLKLFHTGGNYISSWFPYSFSYRLCPAFSSWPITQKFGACAVYPSSLCVSGWSQALQTMAHHSVIMYWKMNCSSTITKTFVCGLEANPGPVS